MKTQHRLWGLVLATAFLTCACDEEGGARAIVRQVTDGDTLRVEFLDSRYNERYAHLADADGWIPVRLAGIDYPDFGSNRSMEKCLPQGGHKSKEYCLRWKDAWNLRYGTRVLDVQKLKSCYDGGMALLEPWLMGQVVVLDADDAEGDLTIDSYRVLRYVRHQGLDISRYVVEQGFAIYFDPTPEDPCLHCEELNQKWMEMLADQEGCLW